MGGILTARIVQRLSQRLEFRNLNVYYDHDISSDRVGKIQAYFGSDCTCDTRLAFLDVAVVPPQSTPVTLLAEIEETTARPKTIIGAVMPLLLASGIQFIGKNFQIGPWTTLI